MLYPQTNEKRLALKLDGIWQFKKDAQCLGESEGWHQCMPEETVPMPVPAAFNEMTQDPELRDYMGMVWYFTELSAPSIGGRKLLRFGAAVYLAKIFLNGVCVEDQHLGKLPFEVDVTDSLKSGPNYLSICIDTRLNWETIPPGTTKELTANWSIPNNHAEGLPRGEYHFDFLNFGGLLRSVWLLVLPEVHIQTLLLSTVSEGDQPVGWRLRTKVTQDAPVSCRVYDAEGQIVCTSMVDASSDELMPTPTDPKPWSPESPYLYRLEVRLGDSDVYSEKVGLRTVRVTPDALLLNGEPVYLTGCGLHEDFHLVGHGHSDARVVKDLTMLKAMGANSFRTAHYPYDESAYRIADEIGLLIIDETPAVGLNAWDAYPMFCEERCHTETLQVHQQMTRIMVERDHRHPSVIMWSLANEVSCYEAGAEDYFKALFDHCREIDPEGLPVTVVQSATPPNYPSHNSTTAKFCDVLCWNRYYAWYQDGGHLEDIAVQLRHEAESWRAGYPDKPLMIAEFGADAVAGMHSDPPVMFSEEYQVEVIRAYVETLDELPYVIGEHVWNFADFMTKQGLTRVIGNRKGIHTRERQPKMAAHFLKQRWQTKG